MRKFLSALFFWALFLTNAFGCPGCIGNGPKDKIYFIVVAVFIMFIYFPMFTLFKLVIKNRNVNKTPTPPAA